HSDPKQLGTLVFTTGSLVMRFALPSHRRELLVSGGEKSALPRVGANAPTRGQLVAICTNNCAISVLILFKKCALSNRIAKCGTAIVLPSGLNCPEFGAHWDSRRVFH